MWKQYIHRCLLILQATYVIWSHINIRTVMSLVYKILKPSILSVGIVPNLICLYNIKLDDSRFNEPYNPSLSIYQYILNTMGETKHSISKWSFEQIGMIGKYCLMRDECVWIIKFHCVHFDTKVLALHIIYTMTFSKHAASHYFTIIEK